MHKIDRKRLRYFVKTHMIFGVSGSHAVFMTVKEKLCIR